MKKPKPAPSFRPNLAGLADCIADARVAALDNDPGPVAPRDFNGLLSRLQAAKLALPKLYQQSTAQPFIDKLRSLGEAGFQQILLQDPNMENAAGLMIDIAQAILQDGEHFNEVPTDAFEEVVADLYDGFLSAQDRSGIKTPDRITLPPMVKWGNPNSGPYTWPVDDVANFDVQTAVVNLPPSNARKGLMAWAALGHETCGHDVLHADAGLQAEMAGNVRLALKGAPANLAAYWSDRIDETSSDVMGILNTGPAAAIGLVAYFRGLSLAFGGNGKLSSDGPADDPHPADILRGYLAAATVRLLDFDHAKAWADAIDQETTDDLGAREITVAGRVVSTDKAKESAQTVAQVIATQPTKTLHQHALIDIQNWRNTDEATVDMLRPLLTTASPISSALLQGSYAAHAVSAAVVAALAKDAPIPIIFSRMLQLLKVMHDKSPTWGPLAVRHRSNISRDLAYAAYKQLPPKQSVEQIFGRLESHFQAKGLNVDTYTKLIDGCFPSVDGLRGFLTGYVQAMFQVNLEADDYADSDLGGLSFGIFKAQP